MRELTFHLLVGLLGELKPPRIPLSHDVGSLLLLHVGLLELLILLPEGTNVGPQPPLSDVRAVLGLGGGGDLGFQLLPQLVHLGPQAGRFTSHLLDLLSIGVAGSLLVL